MKFGISIGAVISILFGLIYMSLLDEPGSAFYLFAALVFLGGPLIGGIVALLKTRRQKFKTFIIAGGTVFGTMFVLFIVLYVVLPQYSRANVQLPEYCNGFDGALNPPSTLMYLLPDGEAGILLTENAESVVVAKIEGNHKPFSSTLYLLRKNDGEVLQSMHFDNDVVTVSIDEGTLYIYNDKLGYLINERTGAFEENFLLIDNYGGLTETDRPFISRASSGNWYLETTAVISSWNIDGIVKSRPRLTFNGIARGCYVHGTTGEVIRL